MFGKTFPLFRVFGIRVQADLSWLIIVVLVTWSLASRVFPVQFEGLSVAAYWAMGAAGAIGLFGSIVLHELAHAVVALRCGIPMKSITLFIFGGVAEMGEEPKTPLAEFLVAIAGPLMSVLIAVVCLILGNAGSLLGLPTQVSGLIWYLGMINGIVVIFNLVPAFPLDGGRVLRSILWRLRGDLTWATKLTAASGSGFGLFLMLLGIFSFVAGNPVGGLWQFLIGLFLRNAASMSYQHVLVKNALAGAMVARFMQHEVVTVPSHITVRELVEDYIYTLHHKLYPVTDSGRLVGCVTTRDVKAMPREEWPRQMVAAVTTPCSANNTIGSDTEAIKALGMMSQHDQSRLMVVDQGQLVGIVALKDMLEFIALRLELDQKFESEPAGMSPWKQPPVNPPSTPARRETIDVTKQ